MTNQKNSQLQSALMSGIILGVALIIFSLILYVVGINPVEKKIWGLPSILILIAGIVYGTLKYRNDTLGGSISYGQALGTGVLIALFAGVLNSIYSYVFMTIIDPAFIDQIKMIAEEGMIEKGMSDDQIERTMEVAGWAYSPWYLTVMGVVGNVFYGFIISLISSAFIKKEKSIFDSDETIADE